MIDGIPLLDLSQGALIALIVIMVLTGRLVPRRNLADVQKERDEWKDLYHKMEQANQDERAQKRALLDGFRTANHFIEATVRATGAKSETEP